MIGHISAPENFALLQRGVTRVQSSRSLGLPHAEGLAAFGWGALGSLEPWPA